MRDDFDLDVTESDSDSELATAVLDAVEVGVNGEDLEPVSAAPGSVDDDDEDTTEGEEEVEVVQATAAEEIPATSRKIRRRGRRTRMRSKTIAMKRLTKEELRLGRLLYPPDETLDARPLTRGECKDMPRPCPFVSCKHHLYLDVNPETGSIKLNFPDLEVWEMKETCALDVADRNGITLEEVGEIMNLTRERIRQVEVRGLLKLKMMSPLGEDD
jgi:hypothetical protein